MRIFNYKKSELRHRFDIESRGIITEINCFGYVACEAAYNHGSLWRKENDTIFK